MSDAINSYSNQHVRDLAWALGSPPLMLPAAHGCQWYDADWYRDILERAGPWLRAMDEDASALAALVAAEKDQRLGRYFELLWNHWFEHSPDYEIIASNLQLQQGGRTIGELDLVVHELASGRNIHIELAVKFYLGLGDTRHQANWYGPNKRDRLDIKMDTLLNRQSVLSRDDAVRQILADMGITIDACAVILKGRLFYPGAVAGEAVTPQDSHPAHQRSVWLPLSEIDRLEDVHYNPHMKRGWMAGSAPDAGQKAFSAQQIAAAVHSGELRLPMYLTGHRKAEPNSRVFVVADDWSTTL